MNTLPADQGTPEVPEQVFTRFLQVLSTAGVPADLIDRLRKTLLEQRTFTEHALKEAILIQEKQL